MGKNEKMREYADEAVSIIKDVIINNELVNGDFIAYVGCNEGGDTIIIRDLLNQETQFSLSEVSYIFMDNLDCIGHMNTSVYKTVLHSKECTDYEKYKDLFMKSLLRLKEIEQCV